MRRAWHCWASAFMLLSAMLPPSSWADQRDGRLDGLFQRLQTTGDLNDAAAIQQQIWQIWIEFEDLSISQLMRRGMTAMSQGDHDEALDAFNVLVNYWWRKSPGYMDTPANVLEYALLSLRDLPDEQRRAWHEVFKFYVFEFDQSRIEHIPESRRGILGPMDDMSARKLRAQLLKKLNR